MKEHYAINLDVKRPEIGVYTVETLKNDLNELGLARPMELNDYNFKMFKTAREAQKFLTRYNAIKNDLDSLDLNCVYGMPKILYKRKYMIQTLMNEKMQTVRHYKKEWKRGQLFQLYDQTYYITVKLTSVTQNEDGNYVYKFKNT